MNITVLFNNSRHATFTISTGLIQLNSFVSTYCALCSGEYITNTLTNKSPSTCSVSPHAMKTCSKQMSQPIYVVLSSPDGSRLMLNSANFDFPSSLQYTLVTLNSFTPSLPVCLLGMINLFIVVFAIAGRKIFNINISSMVLVATQNIYLSSISGIRLLEFHII